MSAKKEVTLILIILLFATAVYADCDITATIDKTVSKTYNIKGKDYTIKFSSLKNESGDISVKFDVNGMSTSDLDQGDEYSFDDVSKITIQSISIGSGSVNTSAQICFTAGLIGYGKGTCSSDTDCDDGNPCTINECEGDPLRCHRTLILWCRDDDGCCQESRCTYEKDNDCEAVVEQINDSTNNQSSAEESINITECISGDDYCPDDCTFESDTDCDECSTDDDCNDDNACTLDICSSSTKECFNTTNPGCNYNGECLSVGTRIETHFCHTNNIMQQFREKKESCDNNYECLNNECIENKCKSPGLFKSIISWFKGLFGK